MDKMYCITALSGFTFCSLCASLANGNKGLKMDHFVQQDASTFVTPRKIALMLKTHISPMLKNTVCFLSNKTVAIVECCYGSAATNRFLTKPPS